MPTAKAEVEPKADVAPASAQEQLDEQKEKLKTVVEEAPKEVEELFPKEQVRKFPFFDELEGISVEDLLQLCLEVRRQLSGKV